MDGLINQVYGAYLLGYDIIRINGKSQISFENRELIKKAIQKLVGMEIVDEDGFNISSQFLLDANTLEAERILRRMNSIIAGMFRDTIEGLKKRAQGIEKLIERRDDEVDRQYFLIVRLIRSAMMNQSLASKLNLSNIDILDYRIAANHLESAGDHIADFASEINEISKTRFIDAIVEAGLLIENMQQGSVAAFVNRNRSESVQVVKIHADFKLVMDSIKQLSAKTELHDPESAIGIINVIHSLEKIARCWVDVADLVKPFYLTAPLRNA
jgi:phosphate uptake regulator